MRDLETQSAVFVVKTRKCLVAIVDICVGCDEKNSAGSPLGDRCPAHRQRSEQPPPQGYGTFAAIERDDRSAMPVRVPRYLRDDRGNKVRNGSQANEGILHIPRTGSGGGGPRWITRYRRAAWNEAHVSTSQTIRRTISRSAVRCRDAPDSALTAEVDEWDRARDRRTGRRSSVVRLAARLAARLALDCVAITA